MNNKDYLRFNDDIYRYVLILDDIKRFRTRFTIKGESVAAHVLGCGLMYADKIIADVRNGKTVDMNKAFYNLVATLVHDFGEVLTGDIPYPAKCKLSKEAKAEIDNMELEMLKEVSDNLYYAYIQNFIDHETLKEIDRLSVDIMMNDEKQVGN